MKASRLSVRRKTFKPFKGDDGRRAGWWYVKLFEKAELTTLVMIRGHSLPTKGGKKAIDDDYCAFVDDTWKPARTTTRELAGNESDWQQWSLLSLPLILETIDLFPLGTKWLFGRRRSVAIDSDDHARSPLRFVEQLNDLGGSVTWLVFFLIPYSRESLASHATTYQPHHHLPRSTIQPKIIAAGLAMLIYLLWDTVNTQRGHCARGKKWMVAQQAVTLHRKVSTTFNSHYYRFSSTTRTPDASHASSKKIEGLLVSKEGCW